MQFKIKLLYTLIGLSFSLLSSNYALNSGSGYILTPNANLQKEGNIALNISYYEPLNRIALIASPFDWMEASIFYTDVNVHKYAPNLDQSYKDKGFNIKFLLKEQGNFPSLAIGFDDIAGTSIFKGEYLVSTMKYESFEYSLGYGFGYYGTRGNIKNIFRNGERDKWNQSTGGQINFNDMFNGKTSLFGAFKKTFQKIELDLTVEYDGSLHNTAIDQIPGFARYLPKSRYNFAINKKLNNFNFSLSKIKGRTIAYQLTYQRNIKDSKKTEYSSQNLSKNKSYTEILNKLANNNIYLQKANFTKDKKTLDIEIVQNAYFNQESLLKNISKDLRGDDDLEITYRVRNGALELYEAKSATHNNKLELKPFKDAEYEFLPNIPYPILSYNFDTRVVSHVGSPSGFYYGGIEGILSFTSILNDNTELKSLIKAPIYNNFSSLDYDPNKTEIPQVRTDIQFYLKNQGIVIEELKLNKFLNFKNNHYAFFSIGHLEQMFSGIHTEYLYRPFESLFSLGFEISAVKKRDYDQKILSFNKFKTLTGHFNFYLMEPKNRILAHFSYGKYLARDYGYTLDISRRFQNGSSIGFFFSQTNLSPEQFGEGSFDKGVYFKFPLNLFNNTSSNSFHKFSYRPVTRDGAAKLQVSENLYELTLNSQAVDHLISRNY
tara:strand:+ start:15534 stop:17513 length:1980 start_codon:yes stop_codon:yes gene_type:complete